MADTRCDWCDAPLAGAVRFCTACGAPLRTAASQELRNAPGAGAPLAVRRRPAAVAEVEPLLVHCPACEASNAASRERCGRCGADLRTGASAQDRAATAGAQPAAADAAVEDAEPSLVLTVLMVVVGLAMFGVIAAIVASRGVGVIGVPGAGRSEGVTIIAVQASSTRPPSGEAFGPDNLVDRDPRTAWVGAAPGDGVGEWLELRLAEAVPVTRIVLWNGFQDDERFAGHARVTRVRLVVGDERLSADVLDVDGPQAIELPEPLVADVVRLEVAGTAAGGRDAGVALSGVEVHAADEP